MEQCNCINEVAEKISEKVIQNENKPKGFAIVDSHWEHKSWLPVVRLYTNFIIESTFIKNDGSTSKSRNNHVSIFFSFCPFCGKEYPKNTSKTSIQNPVTSIQP